MFNLLLVDDEILTREGIVDSFPWKELGIDSIMQADDGISGIKAASECKPNIVLTDVRMPEMDGIEMSKTLRQLYPDCKIIFMSGYSDKDYLMSAIQLKAVSYVEKPIMREELKKVLQDALQMCREDEYKRLVEKLAKKRMDMSIPFIRNEMAIRLIHGGKDKDLVKDCVELGMLDLKPDAEFITVIVRLIQDPCTNEGRYSLICKELQDQIESKLGSNVFKSISSFKDSEYLITHIYCDKECLHLLNDKYLKGLFTVACDNMHLNKYFISFGKRVTGIGNIPISYNTAVIALQKAFFHGYGCVVSHTEDMGSHYVFKEKIINSFSALLAEGNKYEAFHFFRSLASEIKIYENTIINYIKDIFYKLVLSLYKYSERYSLSAFVIKADKDHLWEIFANFNTFDEVMKFSIDKLTDYFNNIEEIQQNKNGISKIMNYIYKNYVNECLSVKDISSHTYMSTAYMCTYFKQETGKTINQYITEYRIERAKELLTNREYRVSEIAGQVGYSDGNYFTKLFKKSIGVTPSEFRERLSE